MSHYNTFEERLEIENGLREYLSFGEIAKRLGKDCSTVSREVRKYAAVEKSGYGAAGYNACIHRPSCTKNHVCKGDCGRQSVKYCKLCGRCNDFCPDFEEQTCIIRMKPPYVCNSCEERNRCTLEKTLYSAVKAQQLAEKNISEARRGVLSTEQELTALNELVTPLILKGHSVHQIYSNNVDRLMCSEKTLYNYIDNGFFDARNIDLPRKVRYRPRRKKKEFKVDKGCYIGRGYQDYQAFMLKHPEYHTVQMDSVIGTVGGKVLLTVHFPDTGFMLAFLRVSNTSQSVIDVFDRLYITLGRKLFEKLFPVILTDRGSEFSNPAALEKSPDGIRRTHVFFCDPNAPLQKGSLEVNHELIRRILPKATSFDSLEQADIDRMMNHINSYRRLKLGNKTPFEAFEFYHGEEMLEKFGFEPIPSNSVILKPSLMKR
ncbi:MAG: IS30 family transposase [Clostridiales bacterium]|jgi:IS30 family transposase|nr:IS30 family transposase [Clostridiales bacterium]